MDFRIDVGIGIFPLLFGIMRTPDIPVGGNLGIVAQQDDAVFYGTAIPDVVPNDAPATILDDHAIVGAPVTDTAVVASDAEGVAGQHHVIRLCHADVRAIVFLIKWLGIGLAGAVDQIACDGNCGCITVIGTVARPAPRMTAARQCDAESRK